jgi:cell division protein FtsQ
MPSATVPASRRPSKRPSRQTSNRARAARAQRALEMLLRTGRLPALLAALGMLTLLWGFMYSNDFSISSVEVRGANLGDSAEVALVAGAIGESIFRIDAGHVAQRVAVLPYVERVTVETRFPDRVVVIVTERIPVIIWESAGQRQLVDERGHVIGPALSSVLPVIAGSGDAPATGDTLDPRVIAASREIHRTLGSELDELHVDSGEGLVAVLDDTRTVILGDASDIPQKLAIFSELERRGENWSLLDLREPGRPYYK